MWLQIIPMLAHCIRVEDLWLDCGQIFCITYPHVKIKYIHPEYVILVLFAVEIWVLFEWHNIFGQMVQDARSTTPKPSATFTLLTVGWSIRLPHKWLNHMMWQWWWLWLWCDMPEWHFACVLSCIYTQKFYILKIQGVQSRIFFNAFTAAGQVMFILVHWQVFQDMAVYSGGSKFRWQYIRVAGYSGGGWQSIFGRSRISGGGEYFGWLDGWADGESGGGWWVGRLQGGCG